MARRKKETASGGDVLHKETPEAARTTPPDRIATVWRLCATLAFWEGGQGTRTYPAGYRMADMSDSMIAWLDVNHTDATPFVEPVEVPNEDYEQWYADLKAAEANVIKLSDQAAAAAEAFVTAANPATQAAARDNNARTNAALLTAQRRLTTLRGND